MKTLEDLLANSVEQPSGPVSELERLGFVRTSELVDDTQDSYFSGLGSDLKFAITNPSTVAAKMRVGAESAITGLRQKEAEDFQKEYGKYATEYLKPELESIAKAKEETRALSEGIDQTYTPKSKAGQFLSDLTQSAPAMLGGLAAGIVAGPHAGVAVGMGLGGGQVYGAKYLERREMGDTPDAASNAAAIHSMAEVGSELLGASAFVKLLKAAKVGAKLTPALAREAFTEGAEETIAGLIQGSEDSFRGAGVTPEGWAGTLEYFKSGKFLEEATENFLGGILMGGVVSGAVMKPIQLSYKPKAVEAVKQMDQAIKAAESAGAVNIQVGDSWQSVETVKEKMGDTIEAFGIKPEEWTEPVIGSAEGEQARLDSAFAGLKDLIAVREKSQDATLDKSVSVEEPSQVEPEAIIDLTEEVVEPATKAVYQAGSVKAYGRVHSDFANTLNDIYQGLDWQPTVELFDQRDITPEDLDYLNRDAKQIATIGSARIFTNKQEDGTNRYSIVGNLGDSKKVWTLSTIMHEALGHVIDYEFWEKAPEMIKTKVQGLFQDWLKTKTAPEFLSSDIIEQVKDPNKAIESITAVKPTETRSEWEARMFREFKAHHISQAMQKRPEVRSVIERYWIKLAKKLEGLYKSFKDNYLDIATNVGTMDEFVDWLYLGKSSQASITNKVDIENFNTKLDPLVEAIYNSLFEIVDGKRRIKDSWRFKRLYQDGKSGRVSRGDIQRSGYSYKELFKERKTLVTRGKDEVLFTIPWDAERRLTKDSARMIAVNVRDLLIISTLRTPKSVRKSGRSKTYNALLQQVDERAKALAIEEGISLNQARLNVMAGQGSAFSKLTPGILGTPKLTDSQANRTIIPMQKDIQKFQMEYPGLFNQLYGDLQREADAQAGAPDPIREVIKDEQLPEVEAPQAKKSNAADEISQSVDALVRDLYNKVKPSERVRDFDKMVEKVIFYFDYKGKDYTEISAELRNLVNATIKDSFQELTGEAIQKEIKNKAVAIDKVLELQKAGADTTLEGIELMQIARDMGMLSDDFIVPLKDAIDNGLEILGSYLDPVDKRMKAVLARAGSGWDLAPGEIEPGDGALPEEWESKDSLTLGDVWKAEPLYTLYPGLANISVRFYNDPDSSVGGSASWRNQYIAINYAFSTADVLDTIVHELQHQIQGIEDFAGGSNETAMERAKADKWNNLIEAQQLVAAALKIQKDIQKGGIDYAVSMASRLTGQKSALADAVLLRLGPNGDINKTIEELRGEVAQLEAEWNQVKDQTGYDLYKRTAGEDEARRASAMFQTPAHEVRVELANRGVLAYSDLPYGTRKIRTDARSGVVNLSVISTTEENANDELLFASYEAMQSDDLAVGRPKISKKVKIKARPIRSEGIYADILKADIKPRKIRKRKTASIEDIEKRRQKTVDFITKMDVIKEHAEKKGLSIAEVMQKAGFESKEIRRSISKYYNLKSKFTQNEMILRLSEVAGLINEETGRDGLTALIQMMFPPVDGETGSDGTLQGLTSMAKDILINQIQNIILAKQGSKYDIESERTLAELGKAFQDEYNKEPGWKKAFSWIKFIQSSAGDFLQTTKPGQALAYKLRKFLLEKTIMQRDYLVRLNEYGRKYDTQEKRKKLYEVISGERLPADEDEKKFLSLVHKINTVFGKEMENLGVKIYKKDGSFTYFKFSKDSSLTYFPHMWEPEWFRNPTQQMIQSLLDSKEATDIQHAKRLIQLMGKDRIRMSKFANIEMERETELGGWITDPITVYTRYIQNSTRRLAAIKIFGENPEVNLAQYAIRHFKESRDADAFRKSRDLINNVLGNRTEDALLKEPKAGMSLGVVCSVGLMLQHAMLVQPGVLANMGAIAGYKNLLHGIAKVLPSLWGNKNGQNNKRWAELAGVLAFTVNRELNDIVMEDEHRLKTDKLLRAFGITQMDGFLRIIGAVTGKLYATDIALRYIERKSPRDERRLRDMGIDPGKLTYEYLQTPQWFSQDLRMAALAFTEDTNFVIDPLRAPSIVQGHPMAKIFMLFKNFAFQQHRMLMKMLRDKEFGQFISVMLGSLAVGSLLSLFRMLIKGEDPEKVLKEDGLVRTIWRAFVTGGGPGLFAEAIGNAATMSSGPVTGMKLDSPALGLIEQGLKAGGSLYDLSQGEETQNDLNQLYRAGAMLLQGIILAKAPMQYGVPIAAGVGIVRPVSERLIAPSESQEAKSIFR